MSSSNCCFLTCIQISRKVDQVVWHSHLFQNFPQFVVIHIVKGFGIVNKAEIDVFLDISCFFEMGVERGERARHQTLSGSEWFQGTPRAGVGGSEGPREITPAHHITWCRTAPQTEANLKISHLHPVTQSSILSRDRITGFVDLAREVVMASQATLSTSHYNRSAWA